NSARDTPNGSHQGFGVPPGAEDHVDNSVGREALEIFSILLEAFAVAQNNFYPLKRSRRPTSMKDSDLVLAFLEPAYERPTAETGAADYQKFHPENYNGVD